MRRWFEDRPQELDRIRSALRLVYPTLHVQIVDEHVVIRGTFPLLHDGREVDSYRVSIRLADDHPVGLPTVQETGGRIKRHEDHHVNTSDGSLCLGVPEELHSNGGPGDILKFLAGPVRSFLFGHSYYVQEGKWPGGEWAHGSEGIREFYSAIARTDDLTVMLTLLSAALGRVEEISFSKKCFCGSSFRFRFCHGPVAQYLRYFVPSPTLVNSFARLAELAKSAIPRKTKPAPKARRITRAR